MGRSNLSASGRCPLLGERLHLLNNIFVVYNKENLERQETNKYGRGTERHLPKTAESIIRPTGERH